MRLIDDEKVVHEYYKNPSYHQLCKVLNEAEEVKAIPIEWIERKLAEHWYVDYDIREMLEDWEKENEGNQT